MTQWIVAAAIGGFWAIIMLFATWRRGRAEALRIAVFAFVVMTLFARGCEYMRPADELDCRPAGPAIHNDC